MRDYEFSLAANGTGRRAIKGQFIKVKTASVELNVIAELESGEVVADLRLSQGGDVTIGRVFDKVRVVNPTGSATTATLIIGLGNSKDNQLSGEVSIGQGQTIATANHALSTTAAEILAAGERRSVIVKNIDASIDVYVGAAGVTSSDGMPLEPGQSMTIDKSAAAALYAVAASGTPALRTFVESD